MTVELGHYALVLALALSLFQSVVPVFGAATGEPRLMASARPTALAVLALIALSFAALTNAYLTSDFSVANVFANSHTLKPVLFKLTGVWGNHEGSMLLWVLILALFAGAVALFGDNLPDQLRANVLGVQGWIITAFLLFILLTSNPFARLDPAPFEGQDLNPILQDIGLAIHPPMLYLGYVGFSVTFSFAVAAMLSGRIDAAFARWVRPWTLAAWIALTAGIAMGSYWAYYELGWGGFWFWDPVENASFLPWLTGTALLHSALVMEKREALKVWTVLLALITFALSLLGTFLVRSGVLTSVHAFASDPSRGVFILAILCVFIGGSFALFAARAPRLQQGGLFAPVSREGALVLNNLFLTVAAATVLIGTLWPLVLEALTGAKISVGAPYFDWTFGPLMIPLLIAVPVGPLLAWKRGDLRVALARLLGPALGALAAFAMLAVLHAGEGRIGAALGLGLAVWMILGSFAEIGLRAGLSRLPPRIAFARLRGLPRALWGTALGHCGMGLTLMGIVANLGFGAELVTAVRPGDSVTLAGYSLRYLGPQERRGPNYIEEVARVAVTDAGGTTRLMEPTRRLYTARRMPTTEAAIATHGFSQLYLSPGESDDQGRLVLRVWWKPLVTLIWGGALVMALGGLVSLSDRRMRVGAPARSRLAVPAE